MSEPALVAASANEKQQAKPAAADAKAETTATATARPASLLSPAPSYSPWGDELARDLANLKLDDHADTPTVDQCIAHLKLLEAFSRLREDIGYQSGLFGIHDPDKPLPDAQTAAFLREKRWAVYVARAVDRFQMWWTKALPAMPSGASLGRRLRRSDLAHGSEYKLWDESSVSGICFTPDYLPPLGE